MMEKCCDPDSPTEKCVVCGETIHTCERETSVNDSYLCPIKSHNNGTESIGGLWVCDKCGDEYLYQDDRKWYDNIDIKWFHPFNFLFYKRPRIDTHWHPSDDLYQYGFSLDLTTEMYYYTYDWGIGFSFRILGFGFEITKVEM
jgi:hypothetical protein